MKNLFNIFILFISFSILSGCGNNESKHTNESGNKSEPENNKEVGNDNGEESAKGDHSFTFTINGNGFSNETFTVAIANDEALAMYTATPVGSNKSILFSASKDDKSIIANLIRKNNALLPLGKDNGDESNFNHSIITITFVHNGQSYTLESISGTCTEKSFQVHSTGVMAAVNATFSGPFSGGPAGTNESEHYEVSGAVDVKPNAD